VHDRGSLRLGVMEGTSRDPVPSGRQESHTGVTTSPENRLLPEQRWALLLASLGSFVVVLDMLIVATALTPIRLDLGATVEQLEWTVNAYTLSFAVLLMTAAGLGNRFGRRRGYAIGLVLFALASAGCALAPDIGTLIAARAVQGVGAAAIMPLALALLNAAFPPHQRGFAIGVYGSATGLGAVLGPVAGGLLTQLLTWEWIFWVNVPVAVVAALLVRTRLKEGTGQVPRVDLLGLTLVSGGVLGLMWGLIRGNEAGWGSVEVLVTLAGGTLLVVVFVLWERRVAAPMLPPRLFGSAAFSAGSAGIFLLNASLTGGIFLTAQFLQAVLGQSPLGAGLQLLPYGVAPFVVTPLAGRLIDRFGARPFALVGLVLVTVGTAGMAAVAGPGVAYALLGLPMTLVGVGLALAMPALTKSVTSSVAPPDLATASGTFSTMRQLGGAFGLAASVAVFTASGDYTSAEQFTAGYVPAVAAAAVLALVGSAAVLQLPGRRVAAPAAAGATTR
jgi:EmrB/QacA subfamily drug resistance transporter